MEKDASAAAPPAAAEDRPSSSSQSGDAAKAPRFNEQTNYVPRRTIITVRRVSPGGWAA